MASLLRGFRYPFGYFSSIARGLVVNGARETNAVNFVQPVQCLCGSFKGSGFATAAARQNDSLERSILRLDQDVKRSGRISRRDLEEVLEEIQSTQSATSSQSLLVLRCCGNLVPEELPEVRTKLVQKIWKTLNKLNIPMDISHYNALLRVYLENEYSFSPTEFLADLEQKGIEPNRVTYQRLISRYCQQGDIEGATKILEFMREKQLPVNENVFNALIMGHSQAGDIDSATGILQVMKQAGLEPSSDTYTTLLCGYAKQGNIEKIKEILDTCEKNEVFLLNRDILEVIYTLAINGNGQEHVDFLLTQIQQRVGYNQDAVITILRLINKGHEEVAVKIFSTMFRKTGQNEGENRGNGIFFINQLVKANRPAESIINICRNLQETNLNPYSTLIAFESAITNVNPKLATALLTELHKSGQQIRQHYFWPLLCSAKDVDEVLEVLKTMQNEFNLPPSVQTVREYVIPNMKEKNYDKIISVLKSAGIRASVAVTSTLYQALQNNDMGEAARLATTHNLYYNPGLYRDVLLKALDKSKDLDSYITIVRHIYENLPKLEAIQEKDDAENVVEEETISHVTNKQAELLGGMIYDVASYFKSNRGEMMHKILDAFVKQGLTISNNQATQIQEKIGTELTPEISEMLEKLSTGELQPSPIVQTKSIKRSTEDMSSSELENFIKTLESKSSQVTNGLKRKLLDALIREKNVEKLDAYIKQLQSEGFVLTSGVYAQICNMHATEGNLEKALEAIKNTREKEPDFQLDRLKAIRVTQLFINGDRLDDALKFLEQHKHEDSQTEEIDNFNYHTTVWRLLNSIAEKGNVKQLKQLFDALITGKYCQPKSILLGTLVKAHLTNDDLEGSLKTFEEICQTYRMTPYKNELACRLIQKEDAAGLQKLTDLSTDIHGEVNSLYDLVFSFVECGRIRQARKILKTPGLGKRSKKINSACERYLREGMHEPLEGLIEATKDLDHIDRMDIYQNLLLSYINKNEHEKAFNLWTKLQEEDIAPSDVFLLTLADFLKKNNVKVPFVLPERPKVDTTPTPPPPATTTQSKVQKTEKPADPDSENVRKFRTALRSNNIGTALAVKEQAGKKLTVTDISNLIESLVKEDRLAEAKTFVLEMLKDSKFPLTKVFRFYLNKLSNIGDAKTFEQLEPLLSIDLKKNLSFRNRHFGAIVRSGNGMKYFEELEKELVTAKTSDEIKNAAEKIPLGGIKAILKEYPELCDRYATLAEKCAKENLLGPMNSLWAYYFIEGNDAKADAIFTKYLQNEPRLMFQNILRNARHNNDLAMAKKIVEQLKVSKIKEQAIGLGYSCLIDIYAEKQNLDDALKVIEEAKSEIGLDNLNSSSLVKVKNGLMTLKKDVPFVIPQKSKARAGPETSSSSSSSSSDDEVTQKK